MKDEKQENLTDKTFPISTDHETVTTQTLDYGLKSPLLSSLSGNAYIRRFSELRLDASRR